MSQEEASRIARAAQRVRRSSRAIKIAVPTAAALGAGAAVAVGSIPGSNGTITGCYNTVKLGPNGGPNSNYGALRLIDPALTNPGGNDNSCDTSSEATITWNQQGTPGGAGPQGSTGSAGPSGTPGNPGTPGAPGTAGRQGPTLTVTSQTTFAITGNGGAEYLKIEGIKGGASDKFHKGESKISSYQLGLGGATQAHGSGGGAGKVMGSFVITKPVDAATTSLQLAQNEGRLLGGGQVEFAKHKGEQPYLVFKFNNVMVTDYKLAGAGDASTETVTFAFQSVMVDYLKDGRTLSAIRLNPTAYKP